MWYAMFSYNLEYAEHSHYISGATHVYRDVLYFIFYLKSATIIQYTIKGRFMSR